MKKLAIVAALLTLTAGAAQAGTALTAAPTLSTAASLGVSITATDGKPIGKLSASVGMGYKGDATGYAIDTQHNKGTKAFGTSHDSTAIYSTDVTTGTPVGDLSNSNSSSFSGWTAM